MLATEDREHPTTDDLGSLTSDGDYRLEIVHGPGTIRASEPILHPPGPPP